MSYGKQSIATMMARMMLSSTIAVSTIAGTTVIAHQSTAHAADVSIAPYVGTMDSQLDLMNYLGDQKEQAKQEYAAATDDNAKIEVLRKYAIIDAQNNNGKDGFTPGTLASAISAIQSGAWPNFVLQAEQQNEDIRKNFPDTNDYKPYKRSYKHKSTAQGLIKMITNDVGDGGAYTWDTIIPSTDPTFTQKPLLYLTKEQRQQYTQEILNAPQSSKDSTDRTQMGYYNLFYDAAQVNNDQNFTKTADEKAQYASLLTANSNWETLDGGKNNPYWSGSTNGRKNISNMWGTIPPVISYIKQMNYLSDEEKNKLIEEVKNLGTTPSTTLTDLTGKLRDAAIENTKNNTTLTTAEKDAQIAKLNDPNAKPEDMADVSNKKGLKDKALESIKKLSYLTKDGQVQPGETSDIAQAKKDLDQVTTEEEIDQVFQKYANKNADQNTTMSP
ncbi:MAG: hypothetical protein Q3962_03300, partial [Corynebacterium sp.]|nr:hypothetical protein [Corynebacterium sp.]